VTPEDFAYPVAGDQLAHYEVIERLASGGMGEIYIAEDTRLGRRVALKVLPATSSPSTVSSPTAGSTSLPWSWSRVRRCAR
jgi:serine/threonine protein kinase